MMTTSNHDSDTVALLSHLLGRELTTVTTYQLALGRLDRSSVYRHTLETCLGSHRERVRLLQNRLRSLGGAAVLPALVPLDEPTSDELAIIEVLEEAEDLCMAAWRTDLEGLDAVSRAIVDVLVTPAVHRTHEHLRDLKHALLQP